MPAPEAIRTLSIAYAVAGAFMAVTAVGIASGPVKSVRRRPLSSPALLRRSTIVPGA